MASPKLNTYGPIWVRLKQRERCRLEVEPSKLATVKRMISKKKDQDIAFKMMNEMEDFKLKFTYDPATMVLIVELKPRWGLEDKVVV